MAMRWTTTEYSNLYRARHLLSRENKKTLGLLVPVEVYVQDPLATERYGKVDVATIYVACEPDLMDGPTSARIAVADTDLSTGKVEPPARWDSGQRCFVFSYKGKTERITGSHRDEPQFHQLNAWAVMQSVLDIYEEPWVLGRSAPWAFEGNRLSVVPHAGYWANAFYARRFKSIRFYYCGPPEKRVYTCLSHDIIAHEMGHAILDGLRPGYIEDSSLETTAFHEFVADLTAIVASLLNNELRWDVAEELANSPSPDPIAASLEVVSSLAEEFGRYATGRPYLRSAQNGKTIEMVQDSPSPYEWSEVLTGAMFDIFRGMVAKGVEKDVKATGKVYPRRALSQAINRFRRTALQPLDYLPPVDVRFSDYATAVLRADEVFDPVDDDDFRTLMRRSFRQRGIDCPSEEEEPDSIHLYANAIEEVARSRTDAYHFLNENRRQLCIPAEQDIWVVDLYHTTKSALDDKRNPPREIVIQYAWRENVRLQGADLGSLAGSNASLLCGGTLVFEDRGNLLSCIRKPGAGTQEPDGRRRRRYCDDERQKGEQRRQDLGAYIAGRVRRGIVGFVDDGNPEDLEARPPVEAGRREDGTLRLQVTPHLRHWTGE